MTSTLKARDNVTVTLTSLEECRCLIESAGKCGVYWWTWTPNGMQFTRHAGDTNTVYVRGGAARSCTCWDHKKHGHACKHMAAYATVIEATF